VHLKQHNITVNGLIPGAITKLFPEQAFDKAASQLRGRKGPDFVAPTIVYLCTDAAKDITGQFFHISGGGVGVYNKPFQLQGANVLAYKLGKWTLDELADVIPPMTK
jgi:hypothetical protein